MDIGALISVIFLILFFGGIFIGAISYEIWKVSKKRNTNQKEESNKQNK